MGTPITGTVQGSIGVSCTGPASGALVLAGDVNAPLLAVCNSLATVKANLFSPTVPLHGVGSGFGSFSTSSVVVDTSVYVDFPGCNVGDFVMAFAQVYAYADNPTLAGAQIDVYEDHSGANVLASVAPLHTLQATTAPDVIHLLIGGRVIAHAGTARVMIRWVANSGTTMHVSIAYLSSFRTVKGP